MFKAILIVLIIGMCLGAYIANDFVQHFNGVIVMGDKVIACNNARNNVELDYGFLWSNRIEYRIVGNCDIYSRSDVKAVH